MADLPPLDDFLAARAKRGDGRPVGRPFEPGNNKNPGGRPKRLEELAASIREHTAELQQRLLELARGMHKARPVDQIAAIKLLYAYGYGNPIQAITGPDGEGLKLGVVILPPEEA